MFSSGKGSSTPERAENGSQDNVRDTVLPPVLAPHYRNLLLATALLMVVLAGGLFFAPIRSRKAAEPVPAPPAPQGSFLDRPPAPATKDPGSAPSPRVRWWDQVTVAAPDPAKEAAGGPGFGPAWGPEGPPAELAPPPNPEGLPSGVSHWSPPPAAIERKDAHREAYERALRSAALRKSGDSPRPPAPAGPIDPGQALLAALAGAQSVVSSPPPGGFPFSLPGGGAPGLSPGAFDTLPSLPGPGQARGPAPTGFGVGLNGVGSGFGAGPEQTGSGVAGILPGIPPGGSTYAVGAAPRGGPGGVGLGLPLGVLRAGTVIPARLETAIDSDAPGPVRARVLRDVLDSETGSRVVIPAGAELLGSVSSQLALGENRLLVAFDELRGPGFAYALPGLEAVESSGTLGLADQVNHHSWSLLGRAVLLGALGAGFEISQPSRRQDRLSLSSGEVLASEVALELDRVAAQILGRGLDRRPTVRVRAGERFAVFLRQDWSPGPGGGR